MFYLFIALVLALAVVAVQNVLHYKEKKELFDRFMAGDYKSYNYFREEYPGAVKEKEARVEEERKRKPTAAELAAEEAAKRF